MNNRLHPDFALVRGDGQVVTKDAIMDAAKTKAIICKVQNSAVPLPRFHCLCQNSRTALMNAVAVFLPVGPSPIGSTPI